MNDYKNQTKFDINDIIKILPHRYPFILIDRIEIIEQGESLIALKKPSSTLLRLGRKRGEIYCPP